MCGLCLVYVWSTVSFSLVYVLPTVYCPWSPTGQPLPHDDSRFSVFQVSLCPRNPLDDKTPTVLVIEHLRRAGWNIGPAPLLHLADSPKFFGDDRFAVRKKYLQCLVAQEPLRRKGLLALPSGESSWYYRAVLAADRPAAVPRGGKMADYKAMLEGADAAAPALADRDDLGVALALCDGSESDAGSDSPVSVHMVALQGSVPAGAPPSNEARHRLAAHGPLPAVASLAVVGGQAASSSAPPAHSPGRVLSDRGQSEHDSDDSDGQLEGLVAGAEAAPRRQPENACIHVEEHLAPGMPGHYRRYTTVCPLAKTSHLSVVACGKRRNCGAAQMGRLGPAAPEAFLMVWRERASAFDTKAAHQRWSPTWAEVRRYMVDHGWPVGRSPAPGLD